MPGLIELVLVISRDGCGTKPGALIGETAIFIHGISRDVAVCHNPDRVMADAFGKPGQLFCFDLMFRNLEEPFDHLF